MVNPILMKINDGCVSNDTPPIRRGKETGEEVGGVGGKGAEKTCTPPRIRSVAIDGTAVGRRHGDYWQVLRACFQNGLDPTAGTLCATLLEWAERRAAEPYQFVAANLADGGKVRRGLGAIARRMAADALEEFEKAVAADGATWSFLRPYAERDAAGMAEVDEQFGDWRGVVDGADRAAVLSADMEQIR